MSAYPTAPLAPPAQPPLSQLARVVDTYIAPSKTFTNILRSATFWLPALILILSALAVGLTVDRQVGFDRVNENAIHASPRREAQMENLTPEQRTQQNKVAIAFTKGITYAVPILLPLVTAIYALILWGCFNFVLGARTTFQQVYAVVFYASLPYLFINLLTIATLYFGNSPETYNYQNPIGSNAAYYLPDASPILRALLTRLDIFQLWITGLTLYGMAIVAKKSLAQSAMVVGTLWVLLTLITVAGAAFS